MDKCIRDVGIGTHDEEIMMYGDYVEVLHETRGAVQEVANKWWAGMEQNG